MGIDTSLSEDEYDDYQLYSQNVKQLSIVKKYKDPKYGVICLLRDKRDRIFLMKQKEYSKRDFHY